MLKSEKAISNQKEDFFNRENFIKRISEGILNYKDQENFVIGLEGEWGIGKTSILNLIEDKIKNDIDVFRFSPWNFVSRKQIISDFFEQFSYFMNISNRKDAKEISQILKSISKILKPFGLVPIAGDLIKILSNGMEELSKGLTPEEIDFENMKDKINNYLIEDNKKILIMIDDIDRLSDSEIIEIFQLIKGAGKLNNVIYLLAYDYNLVTNSLNSLSKARGSEYLEKIVQIQIEVPIILKEHLVNKFIIEIDNIFNQNNILSSNYIELISFLLKDMRQVEKILNSIRFGKLYAENNLDIQDYIIMKTLQCTNSKMYKFFLENRYEIEENSQNLNRIELNTPSLKELILQYVFKCSITPASNHIMVRKNSKRDSPLPNSKKIYYRQNRDLYFNYF